MTTPTPPANTPTVAAAVSTAEAAAKAEVTSVWTSIKTFVGKYWPIAAGIAIAATRFL